MTRTISGVWRAAYATLSISGCCPAYFSYEFEESLLLEFAYSTMPPPNGYYGLVLRSGSDFVQCDGILHDGSTFDTSATSLQPFHCDRNGIQPDLVNAGFTRVFFTEWLPESMEVELQYDEAVLVHDFFVIEYRITPETRCRAESRHALLAIDVSIE